METERARGLVQEAAKAAVKISRTQAGTIASSHARAAEEGGRL